MVGTLYLSIMRHRADLNQSTALSVHHTLVLYRNKANSPRLPFTYSYDYNIPIMSLDINAG